MLIPIRTIFLQFCQSITTMSPLGNFPLCTYIVPYAHNNYTMTMLRNTIICSINNYRMQIISQSITYKNIFFF